MHYPPLNEFNLVYNPSESDKADSKYPLVRLVRNTKKTYARITAKRDELDGLTGELQRAYTPVWRGGFLYPDERDSRLA